MSTPNRWASPYVHADITAPNVLPDRRFDLVVCSFGLTDIDDLDAALSSVIGALTPHGRFVFSMLHPCFAGGATVSGSWPTACRYLDEGRWVPKGAASSLRRQVGATHRTLSSYINALAHVGLRLDGMSEPSPPAEWIQQHADAAHLPAFLVAGCSR